MFSSYEMKHGNVIVPPKMNCLRLKEGDFYNYLHIYCFYKRLSLNLPCPPIHLNERSGKRKKKKKKNWCKHMNEFFFVVIQTVLSLLDVPTDHELFHPFKF